MIKALVTHPVLVVPNWSLPFTLYTDASELVAVAVLMQAVENREACLGYTSHCLTRAEERLSPNDREVLGVLDGIEQLRTYLQHRRFALVTAGAALTWLFSSQNLSSKNAQVGAAVDVVRHRAQMVEMRRPHDARCAVARRHILP